MHLNKDSRDYFAYMEGRAVEGKTKQNKVIKL